MKKMLRVLSLLLIFTMLFSTVALAKSDNAKRSLVALGDSIPFGYNLGTTNDEPSRLAFPYLIGEEASMRVRNLAGPGWTTGDLLDALEHPKYRQAVKHADYVTLNIGNNDLLRVLGTASFICQDPILYESCLTDLIVSSGVFDNLNKIVIDVRSLTDAKIIVYNVYNPFNFAHPLQTDLHLIGNLLLPTINGEISTLIEGLNLLFGDIVIADAFSAFGTNQSDYVIFGDIHPTEEGHYVLKEIGLEALGFR